MRQPARCTTVVTGLLAALLLLPACQGGGKSPTSPAAQGTGTGAGAVVLAESSARFIATLTLDGRPILDDGFWYGETLPGQVGEFAIVPQGDTALTVIWETAFESLEFQPAGTGLNFTWTAPEATGEARIRVTIETPAGSLERLYRFWVDPAPVATDHPIPYPLAQTITHDPYADATRDADYPIAQDELLVQVTGDPESLDVAALFRGLHLQVLYRYPARPAFLLYNASGRDLWEVIADLRALPFVEYADPNPIWEIDAIIPDDPDWDDQYCLPLQSLPEAWEITTGDVNHIIAIMDTGTGRQHPDLMAKIVDGGDFVTPPGDGLGGEVLGDGIGPDRNVGHGVHCSGISGAITNNALGGAGMDWESRIMGLRIFPINGDGGAPSSAVIGAHDFIRTHNENPDNLAKVVSCNMSFGGGGFSALTGQAIADTTATGVTYVAAAGNNGSFRTTYWPAAYEHVIAVANITSTDEKSGSSNWGPFVDVSAAGTAIWNTYFKGPPGTEDPNIYAFLSGTSMAAPQVAGQIGLIKAYAPDLTPAQVTDLIMRSADDHYAVNTAYIGGLGTGRINAFRSLTENLAADLHADGSISLEDDQAGVHQGNRDGLLNPNEIVRISPAITNTGIRSAELVEAAITTLDDPWLRFIQPVMVIKEINPTTGMSGVEGWVLKVSPDTPDNYEATIEYTITDPTAVAGPWDLSFTVRVERNSGLVDLAPSTATDLTGGVLPRPALNQPFFQVDLAGDQEYLIIDRLIVSLLGTAPAAAVTNVRLWLDEGDGLFGGAGSDQELGLANYWNTSYHNHFDRQADPASGLGPPIEQPSWEGSSLINGTVTFRGLRIPITESGGVRLFVSADVTTAARDGETVGLGVLAPGDVALSVGDAVSGLPWASSEATIINAWTPPAEFTFSDGNAWRARTAIDDEGHLLVVYDGNTFGDYDIYVKYSHDGGNTWNPDETNITTDPSNDFYPDVAFAPDGSAHVVFYGTRDGNRQIYALRSDDFGVNWTEELRVNNTSGDSRVPRIVASSTGLHTVYFDNSPGRYEVFVQDSTDNGAAWTDPVQLSATTAGRHAADPEIALAGDTLYVAWDEHAGAWNNLGNASTVQYTWRPFSLPVWVAPTAITTAPAVAYNVDLAAGEGTNLYVAWHQSSDGGENEIWLTRINQGLQFPAEQVTAFTNETRNPSIEWSPGGRIDLCYENASGSTKVVHRWRADDESDWSAPVNLSQNSSGAATFPVLTRDIQNGNMWALWQDPRSGGTNMWFSRWIEE